MIINKDRTKGEGIDGNYSSVLDMESDDIYACICDTERRKKDDESCQNDEI